MIELRILGSPDIVGTDGSQLLSVLHRPKSLGLLSYLAVEGFGAYQRRDRLLGLFWPEAEERKARSSLSEALSRLRQSLGPDVILTRGNEEIALSPTALWVDVPALLAAAEGEKLNEVARLYRGPLLDGFFLDESVAFDHWLDSTRARLERIALEALGALTDSAAVSGDQAGLTWAERAVALSPTDAASVRRLMTLQTLAGHRTAALDAFDHYVRRLTDERGLEPSAELVDLVSRIRSGETDIGEDAGPAAAARSTSASARLRLISGGPEADDFPDALDETDAEGLPEPDPDLAVVGRERPSVDGTSIARPRRGLAAAFAGGTISLAVVATWFVLSAPTLPVVRSDVTPPPGSELRGAEGGVNFTLSPDGQRFVYVGEGPEGTQLWERQLGELDPRPIPGTEAAAAPVFSPDGSSIAFMQRGRLRTVSLAGGLPFTVLSGLEGPPFLDWGPDGKIYYARGTDIHRVPSGGGEPERVTTEFEGASARLPHVLPEARGVLVTLRRSGTNAAIGVVGPEGGAIRELFRGTTAQYTTSGDLVYATIQGELMSVPFDVERLEQTGSASPLLGGVPVSLGTSTASFSLAASGGLVYQSLGTPPTYQAVWVDRSGRSTEIDPDWTFGGDSRWSSLALSPTGDRLAISATSPGVDIWIKDLDGAPAEKFTFTGRGNQRPAWSHDGEYLTYARAPRQGEWETVRRRADGTGEAETLLDVGVNTAFYSLDGAWMVYARHSSSGDADIFGLRIGVDSVGEALLAEDHYEWNPVLSPDGRWLAYTSNETGRFEVYLRSFPEVRSLKRQISTSGGSEVLWSRSGRELFYRNGANELVSVEVTDEPTFSVRGQTVLFSAADFLASLSHPIYDVRPDDQAFVMIEAVAGQPDRLILVQNLFGRR